MDRIAGLDLNDGGDDPDARAIAIRTVATLFSDNCAACHGQDAKGGHGLPNLRDGTWLWGGSAEDIHETLRVGINSLQDETRFGQMPAFGSDQILERADILALVTYVRHLAGLQEAEAEVFEAGAALFAENCASCHGEDAQGRRHARRPQLGRRFLALRRRSRDGLQDLVRRP